MGGVSAIDDWKKAWASRFSSIELVDKLPGVIAALSETASVAHPSEDSSLALPDSIEANQAIRMFAAPGWLPMPNLMGSLSRMPKNFLFIAMAPESKVPAFVAWTSALEGLELSHKIGGAAETRIWAGDWPVRTFARYIKTSIGEFADASDGNWMFETNDEFAPSPSLLYSLDGIFIDDAQLVPSNRVKPLALLEEANCPLGVFCRTLLLDPDSLEVPTETFSLNDIDIIAVTTSRFRSVWELARSIRDNWGEKPNVHVVVQTKSNFRWRALSKRFKVELTHVTHDTGLSECRNVAVEKTSRPLVFLMDDDFQIDERARLHDALMLLARNPPVAVLGGNLLDVSRWTTPRNQEISQSFAMKLLEKNRFVRWLRVEDAPRRREYYNPVDYIEYCDIVDNFALIRRPVFDRGIRWNSRLKIGAEHQDFFLRLQEHPDLLVARTNALKVRNVRVQDSRFKKLRNRTGHFFSLFFQDLNLDGFQILGERMRGAGQDGGNGQFEQNGSGFKYFENRN